MVAEAEEMEKPMAEGIDPAEKRLHELGYKQELKREMNLLEIVGVSSSVLNPYITIIPFYTVAISYGGPVALVWPWWPTFFFIIIVGLSLSEICSSYPTVGSLYFWASSMCPPKWRSFVSWMTAWLELVALMVGDASVAFPAAQILQQIILLMTGGANGGGYFASKGVFFAIYAGMLFSWSFIISFGVKYVSKLFGLYVYFNLAFTVMLCIVLPLVAPTRQDASYVFTHWEPSSAFTGIHGVGLNWMFATLLAQWSGFGFDHAAHVTEETKNSDTAGPKAMMAAIFIEMVLGYCLILVLTFCIQGYWGDLYSPENATGGLYPPMQIIYDVFHNRYGNAGGAYVIFILMLIPFYMSGLAGTLGASRTVYALARDNVLPLSHVWRRVTATSRVPVNAAWLVATVAVLVGLPNFGSTVAFNAIASLTTVGYMCTYGVAIFFRFIMKDEDFKRGPFHLGAFSKICNLLALTYITYTVGIFMVPSLYPVTWKNFNYAPIAFTGVMVPVSLWWLVDARKWFTGPVRSDGAKVEPM